jgi:hypothetical protein
MGWRGPAGGSAPALARGQELAALKVQAASLGHALGALMSRIEQIEKPDVASSGRDPQ